MNQPNILIISTHPWSERLGNDTFSSIIGKYNPKKIGYIFVRNENPNFALCDNYFFVSEKIVFKSILRKNCLPGTRVTEKFEFQNKDSFYHGGPSIFYYTKMFIREILWKIGKWKNENLNSFLESFKPNIVLYEMSRYPHINRLVRYSIRFTQARGVGCFWDDTFTYKQRKSLGFFAFRFFQRKSLKKLSAVTSLFFSITDKTKKEADKVFKVNSIVLSKPASHLLDESKSNVLPNAPAVLKMFYAGNLGIGRDKTLLLISEYIKNFSEIKLIVYSNSDLKARTLNKLLMNGVEIHKSVPKEEMFKIMTDCEILLFLENLSGKNKIARLSFSTKLTDYLSCNKLIWAVGNKDLAPISYLLQSDAAIVSTNKKEIADAISLMSSDFPYKKIENARKLFLENHSIDKTREVFWRAISKLV